jgi:hypothetical protein
MDIFRFVTNFVRVPDDDHIGSKHVGPRCENVINVVNILNTVHWLDKYCVCIMIMHGMRNIKSCLNKVV